VTIDAQRFSRVILCDRVDGFRLEGSTLTGGDAGETDGGGVVCLPAAGAFVSCRFTGNWAGRGGGLTCYYSDPLAVGGNAVAMQRLALAECYGQYNALIPLQVVVSSSTTASSTYVASRIEPGSLSITWSQIR
jgi:hypothetical protein